MKATPLKLNPPFPCYNFQSRYPVATIAAYVFQASHHQAAPAVPEGIAPLERGGGYHSHGLTNRQYGKEGVFIEKGPFFHGKGASRTPQIPHRHPPPRPSPPLFWETPYWDFQYPPPPPVGRGRGGGCIRVKWVPFVKLVFSPGNLAHFGSKMGLFSAFSHYVFNDCGPNHGFRSDFALSPILTL